MVRIISPKYFILGLILGFITCCLAGYIASQNARFKHFSRFFLPIQPQTFYYPTANELLTTALHEANPDKILVLIGGSSIFRGYGQDPEELWSKELQRLLGENYRVLNFAIDGAPTTSFGAVAFRILKEKYKKIIFVADCAPHGAGPMDGSETFNYLFWDAYYKNLIHFDKESFKTISQTRATQLHSEKGIELHVMSYLDSWFFFKNLWNWVAYEAFFTHRTDISGIKMFKARSHYTEQPNRQLKEQKVEILKDHFRFRLGSLKAATKAYDDFLTSHLIQSKQSVKFNAEWDKSICESYESAFEKQDRKKILCTLMMGNPRVISALPQRSRQAHDLLYSQANVMLAHLGYRSMIAGQYFVAHDYLDEGHLVVSGGKKMALQMAKEIENMAVLNGYLK